MIALLLAALAGAAVLPDGAVDTLPPVPPQSEASSDAQPPPDPPAAIEASPPKGKLKLGGAIRARYDLRFNDVNGQGQKDTSSHLSFDTLLLTADYDSSVIFGSAQYRFYGGSFIYGRASGYKNYPGEISFPMYAYVGAKLSPRDKVTVGLQPVPFDERWWGSAFFNSLGFVYGLEEVYNMGVTVSHQGKHVGFDVGYFPTTAANAFGISEDSARFSVNFVKGDSYLPAASHNTERNMVVGRVNYRTTTPQGATLTLMGSGWFSTIHNFDTGQDGTRRAFALSAKLEQGAWHAKLLAARQDIDARNPIRNDLIAVGDYDSSFNIATRGTMLFGEVGRQIDTGKLPVKLSLYANYARFLKQQAGFADSERLTLGAFWTDKAHGHVRVWSELMVGRNDPYVGAGQYVSGAAQGGDNRLKSAVLVLMGYYF
ncbi:hypothetical protein [Novosphingobium terrae]|uniref:hypothetical protein n=1 Tax=Novosphingobium terrae TaxID=2726189 RepID=UPI001F12C007|nr:hypothetical protein [Novosphingobium terrae]